MTSIPTTSTSNLAANRRRDRELAAMGVESLFIGGYNLLSQVKQINSHWECYGNLLGADPRLKQRSGRYRRKVPVPT